MAIAPQLAQLKAEFDRDGFVVVRDLLPPVELALLRQNLDRYMREVVPKLADADAFYECRAAGNSQATAAHGWRSLF